MFDEIVYLKNNLDTPNRGEAVLQIKAKIQGLIDVNEWEQAESFFYAFNQSFKKADNIHSIIKNEFQFFVNSLLKLNQEFSILILLYHLTNLPWFEQIDDSEYKRGCIAENLSPHGMGILKIQKLQEARRHYRKALKNESAARVQRILSAEVRSFTWCRPSAIDQENQGLIKIRQMVADNLQTWKTQPNENKMGMLASDAFGICPIPYQERQEECQDFFLSGFLEQAGAIQTVGLSSNDGRVDAGKMAPIRERINFKSHEQIMLIFFSDFSIPVKEWLILKNGENRVFQLVEGSLKTNLGWDENSILYFMEGMTAWLSNYPQVAQSFWIPFFESALRNRLADFGEDVINPKPRIGIEDFILFDSLLKKAEKHYQAQTVEYWRLLFSTKNGLGWNLRNDYCHGILPLIVMKQDLFTFAVFLAYLYLLYPCKNDN
jgi:hypothetical protein